MIIILCIIGNCGNISTLNNGTSLLFTDIELENKKGELRLLEGQINEQKELFKKESQIWIETRKNYEEFKQTETLLKDLQEKQKKITKELEPLQLVCAYCGWQWPENKPNTYFHK